MIFAPTLRGEARAMIHKGHLIYNEIDQIPYRPDVIHAHHVSPCFIAMVRFPDVPVVYTCHSSVFELEAPMLHPQIKHYVAVDQACRDKCLSCGIPADQLSVIENAVDPMRYVAGPKLPDRPRSALLLTKYGYNAEPVRAVCSEKKLHLDELGGGTNKFSNQLEKELPKYDLVFATARMALEAAFVGCSVIVCDARGFAGLLTPRNMKKWRKNNFGVRLLTRPTTVDLLREAIEQYNAGDAAIVTQYLREQAAADGYVSKYEKLYRSVIKAGSAEVDEAGLANGRWAQELVATAEKRLWYRVASEMQWMPEHKTVGDMLNQTKSEILAELNSMAAGHQSNAVSIERNALLLKAEVEQLQQKTSTSTEILVSLRAMYQALVPPSFRRLGAVLRSRSAKRTEP